MRDQVPAPARGNQSVRLHVTAAAFSGSVQVTQAKPFALLTGHGDKREDVRLRLRPVAGQRHHERIAALRAWYRAHRVAELPEPADVPADGPGRDAEARRQFVAAPARPGGEQRQHREQPSGGVGHATIMPRRDPARVAAALRTCPVRDAA
jgi:hypothetical protein